MTESELIAEVESCRLPIEAFTHVEHVRLAWSYLERLPLLTAIATFRQTLRAYAAHHAKSTLYHETITVAYMLIVFERMARCAQQATWPEFAARNADLLVWKDGPFFQYYPSDVLADAQARASFVMPSIGAVRPAASAVSG